MERLRISHTEENKDRQTDGQAGRQTDKQTDRQTDRQTGDNSRFSRNQLYSKQDVTM